MIVWISSHHFFSDTGSFNELRTDLITCSAVDGPMSVKIE